MSAELSQQLASLKIDRSPPPQPTRRGWGRWLMIFAAITVTLAALVVLGNSGLERLTKPKVTVGEVITISPAQADVKLMTTGYVVPRRRAIVAAKRAGRLEQMLVVEGQDVKEGQLVATLDSADSRAALAEARAAQASAEAHIAGADASLVQARLELAREKQLFATGASGQAAVDGAQSRYDIAEANLKAAKAESMTAAARVENAAVALDNTRITAPFSGRVVRKLAEVGEVPSSGVSGGNNGVVELVDFASLVVDADVSEGRIETVRVGGPAEITLDAFPSKRFRGEVLEIRPTVDRQKATVLVRVKFIDEVPGLLPQMAAKVLFLAKALDAGQLKEPPKPVVPSSAVIQRAGVSHVFVLSEGRVRMSAVQLGAPMGSNIELKQGPAPGTKVVLDPPATLQDGDAVKEKIAN